MSLHTRCPQRLLSISAHRTLRRRRGVRYYGLDVTNDPEWFQQVRTQLLSRKPHRYSEDLDPLHHEQLWTTLAGFQPRFTNPDTNAKRSVPLFELLTRFNARVQSSTLLPDGTDPLHSPGEPWTRRMWAGGAVRINPGLKLKSETPFRLLQRAACVERIKDVRLQGTGDEAKIFVTIERRFTFAEKLRNGGRNQSGGVLRTYIYEQADSNDDWNDALLKEERNLVFLKAKTAAELTAVHAGETLVPRYLKSPSDPDFSHAVTPTRSLLFRYSALTFNAHLLHLDPTYARTVEGHRNLLVHGPLTLTLMLQSLNKHLLKARIGNKSETVDSIQYRNLAPLYCDEEMRVCVKNKKRSDTANVWDIWIEGPTGGMAVKAVVRTVNQERTVSPTNRTTENMTNAHLPDVHTVAFQAKDKLKALDQKDSGTEQLSQVSREERRKLWRKEQLQTTRVERREWAARALPYLYSASSPLVVRVPKSASQTQKPSAFAPSITTPQSQAQKGRPTLSKRTVLYSRRWRKARVGKALPYLYMNVRSPLQSSVEVARQPDSPKTQSLQALRADASSPRSSTPSLAHRQRAILLASTAAQVPPSHDAKASTPDVLGSPASGIQIRKIITEGPEDVLSHKSMQKETGSEEKSLAARSSEREPKPLTIRKVEQVSVRKVDVSLQETAAKRSHKMMERRKETKRADGANKGDADAE